MTNLPHIIEVAILLLVAYLIGCLIGYFLRSIFTAPDPVKVSSATTAPIASKSTPVVAAPKPKTTPAAPKPAAQPKPAPAPKTTASAKSTPVVTKVASDGRPQTLDKARGGKKDNLKRIKGIGPKIETILNKLGIYHFDQIAVWNKKTVSWVDDYLSFKGRIDREEWIKQAKALAKGEETEFSKRVDKGAVASSKKAATSKGSSKKK